MKKNFLKRQAELGKEEANRDLAEIRKLKEESRALLNTSLLLPKIKVTENKNLKKYVKKLETNGINFNF